LPNSTCFIQSSKSVGRYTLSKEVIIQPKTVLYLISQPLDQRNFDRFGIRIWREKGWHVDIIDLTPLLYPKVWDSYVKDGKRVIADDNYFQITKKSALDDILSKRTYVLYIDLVQNQMSYYLHLKLKLLKAGTLCLRLMMGSMPLPKVSAVDLKSLNGTLFYKFKYAVSFLTKYGIYRLYSLRFNQFQQQLFIATSGKHSFESAVNMIPRNNIIKVHNFDYDRFLEEGLDAPNSDRYIVFLDEDMPYHSDFIYLNTKSPVSHELYFNSLNNFLQAASKEISRGIKIAAHPRSNYINERADSFRKSQVFKNQTVNLVKDCAAVICHASASIQLAVIYKKPVVFVTTDELENSSYREYIDVFARSLGKIPVNIDRGLSAIDWKKELTVNKALYTQYMANYIKHPATPEMPAMEIIANFFEEKL
jgi:hypothetical protein